MPLVLWSYLPASLRGEGVHAWRTVFAQLLLLSPLLSSSLPTQQIEVCACHWCCGVICRLLCGGRACTPGEQSLLSCCCYRHCCRVLCPRSKSRCVHAIGAVELFAGFFAGEGVHAWRTVFAQSDPVFAQCLSRGRGTPLVQHKFGPICARVLFAIISVHELLPARPIHTCPT